MSLTAVRIQVLGDFSISYSDAPIQGLNTARLQSLLAYLVLHADAPQSRQHIAFQLWPDAEESQARNNLRQFLYQLRQVLPDPDRFLTINASTACWNSDD